MAEIDLSGPRNYLRRTKTIAELKAMADALVLNGALDDEVLITANSFEGGSFSGVPNMPKRDLLQVIEEILLEAGETPLTGGRQVFGFVDYSTSEFKA